MAPKLSSMFGVNIPISRCRKASLDDFDGVRTILSRSKLRADWTPHIAKHGDLFYVEVGNRSSTSTGNAQRQHKSEFKRFTNDIHCLEKNHSGSKQNIPNNDNFYHDDSTCDVNSSRRSVDSDNLEVRCNHIPQTSLEDGSFDSGYRISRGSSTSSSSSSSSQRTSSRTSSHSSLSTHPNKQVKSGKKKMFYFFPDFSSILKQDISGITLCEKLFGIVLCQYKHKPPRPNGKSVDQALKDKKIIVQGVIPDSEAQRCGKIYRGDMLLCINDVEVSWINIDEIFRMVPNKKVKLTFKEPVVISASQLTPPRTPVLMSPNHPAFPASQPTLPRPRFPELPKGDNLLSLASYGHTQEVKGLLENSLCTAMYLTMDNDVTTDSGKNDICYQFPASENKLIEIRGLFPTLSSILPEVTNNKPTVSTISYKDCLVHIGYWNFEKDVFILGLPADRVDIHIFGPLMSNLLRVVEVLFSSISGAFRHAANKERLDQLFMLSFYRLIQNRESSMYDTVLQHSERLLLDTVTGVRWLHLSEENKMMCDEILSEFEAADFDDLDENITHSRRIYSILGTCLFYKEHLLCSHLPIEDQRDVHLFLTYHSVLSLVNKQSLEELVIWREIFPTRRCHCPEQFVLGFTEPDGRWFLLVVGMKHFLLAVILEAGGCSQLVNSASGPNPFFVDQAKATLLQLQTEDVGMAETCEERLLSECEGPSLVSADMVQEGQRSGNFIMSPLKPLGSPCSASTPTKCQGDGNFKWRFSPQVDKKSGFFEEFDDRCSLATGISNAGSESSVPEMNRQGSKISYGSNDSGGSGGSGGMYIVNKLSNKGSVSAFDLSSVGKNGSGIDETKPKSLKLSRGPNNVLFHYLCIDHQDGMFVAPTPTDVCLVRGAIHEILLENFHKSCLIIHNSLTKAKVQVASSKLSVEEDSPVFGKNKSFKHICEQGILFQCPVPSQDSKRLQQNLEYWVIGRLFPDGREMFVCVHETVPQNVVELAFSLQFGL